MAPTGSSNDHDRAGVGAAHPLRVTIAVTPGPIVER
jgi:hypothetical protein